MLIELTTELANITEQAIKNEKSIYLDALNKEQEKDTKGEILVRQLLQTDKSLQ